MIRHSRRWRLGGLLLLAFGIVVEGSARLAIANKARLLRLLPAAVSPLHDYQEWDPEHRATWRLKPGFVKTFGDAMPAGARGANDAGEVFIRINTDGFRGPEIDRSSPHVRILTIGDSCTFGALERASYPRVLERELRARGQQEVEVINAGVEGYAPRDVLFQLGHYSALRPAIVTVYIGWSSLYKEANVVAAGPRRATLASVRLLEYLAGRLRPARRTNAVDPVAADPAAPDIARLDAFVPAFMPEIEEIVRVLRSSGSRVVLVTLPGLFALDLPATDRALRLGGDQTMTENPYVLAKLAERYNVALRALAARDRLDVIDLAIWSRTALTPRDAYFSNAIHLSDEAQVMVGRYMADLLEPVVDALSPGQVLR